MRSPGKRDFLSATLAALLFLGVNHAAAKPSCGTGGATGQTSGSAGAGTFVISVPSSYSPSKAIPLLLALHGDEGKPDYIHSSFRGLQQSTGGAFILVSPRAPYGGGSWYKSTSNHRDFVDAVIQKVLSSYNIDQDRVWITGWSGGATFLGYYAIKRQDILASVTFYMGGGSGGYGYSPPAGSCKIPGRFVIGTKDFLYKLASNQRSLMKQNGHEVAWVELPGVGHSFQKSTLAATWSWISARTLCGKTTPGSCGPGSPSKPDAGAPAWGDQGTPFPARPDGAAPPTPDAGAPGADMLTIQRDARLNSSQSSALQGGCSAGRGGEQNWWLVVVLVGVVWWRRRGRIKNKE